LIGYGAATNALDSSDYFLSLSDSYTAYMTAFYEFSGDYFTALH